MMTEIYAAHVFVYLEENGMIAPVPGREVAARSDASEYLILMNKLYSNRKVLQLK